MTGTVAYILAKKIALGAVSGIANISFENGNLIFKFKDGSSTAMHIPLPEDGITPQIGANGNWFIGNTDTGIAATGPAGKDGDKGEAGKDGLSAYEIAVAAGFKGTEQEWIESLVGTPGEDGNSITDLKIDEDRHLICTLSNGDTIDAGELPVCECESPTTGKGLAQFPTIDDFPEEGNTEMLYLALDKGIIYYWDDEYKSINSQVNWGLASEEDIDNLFEDTETTAPEDWGLASPEDIDGLFGDINNPDTDLGLASPDAIDGLFN